MQTYNPFLTAAQDSKGGGIYFEDPSAVENICVQTAAAAPGKFESSLAAALMGVFAAGATRLEEVVLGLNRVGSRDGGGQPWTAESLAAQLAQSADGLFSVAAGDAHE